MVIRVTQCAARFSNHSSCPRISWIIIPNQQIMVVAICYVMGLSHFLYTVLPTHHFSFSFIRPLISVHFRDLLVSLCVSSRRTDLKELASATEIEVIHRLWGSHGTKSSVVVVSECRTFLILSQCSLGSCALRFDENWYWAVRRSLLWTVTIQTPLNNLVQFSYFKIYCLYCFCLFSVEAFLHHFVPQLWITRYLSCTTFFWLSASWLLSFFFFIIPSW